jgi:MFS family permease
MFVQSIFTFYFPARQALIADSIPPEKRGIGFAATAAIPSAFGLAAPFVGGWLIETYGITQAMRGLYFSGFFIAAAVAFFRLRFLKETLINPRTIDLSLNQLYGLLLESYRSAYRILCDAPRRLWSLSMLVSTCVFFASLVSSFWVVRVSEVIGLNAQQWGTVMMVSGAVSVVLGIPAGVLVDRFSKRWIVGVCLIIGAGQSYLFLRCSTFEHVTLLAVFTTLTNAFLNPAFQSLFADMTPRQHRGRVLATIGGGGIWLMRGAWGSGVLGRTTQTIGSFLSGFLYGYNNALPWTILSIALFALGVMFITWVQEPEIAEI